MFPVLSIKMHNLLRHLPAVTSLASPKSLERVTFSWWTDSSSCFNSVSSAVIFCWSAMLWSSLVCCVDNIPLVEYFQNLLRWQLYMMSDYLHSTKIHTILEWCCVNFVEHKTKISNLQIHCISHYIIILYK